MFLKNSLVFSHAIHRVIPNTFRFAEFFPFFLVMLQLLVIFFVLLRVEPPYP